MPTLLGPLELERRRTDLGELAFARGGALEIDVRAPPSLAATGVVDWITSRSATKYRRTVRGAPGEILRADGLGEGSFDVLVYLESQGDIPAFAREIDLPGRGVETLRIDFPP